MRGWTVICACAVACTGCGDGPVRDEVTGGTVQVEVREAQVKVIHYKADRVDNPNLRGETTYAEFEGVRQALVATCRRFGVTGPDGLPESPAYYVVDDQYNDELYQYVEVYDPAALSAGWLRAVMATLAAHPGWGVGVKNIRGGYLLIFADRLMVTGAAFTGCDDLASVAAAASKSLGSAEGKPE